jgi:hypothetical protein
MNDVTTSPARVALSGGIARFRNPVVDELRAHARHLRAASNRERVTITKYDEWKTQALLLEALAVIVGAGG